MILNETPVRTARNFGINNIKIEDIEIPRRIEEFNGLTIMGDILDVKISDDTQKEKLTYGISDELLEQSQTNSNQDIKIVIDNSNEKNIYLDFNFDDESTNLIDNIEINANELACANIILKYTSDDINQYYHNGILKIVNKFF